jgi:tetratricopeptide (TPR) repeat protein
LLGFCLTTNAYCAEKNPVPEAEMLFRKGYYGKGFSLLTNALRTRKLDEVTRLTVMKALADFYGKEAGNTEKALMVYKKIIRDKTSESFPAKREVQREISLINMHKEKYHKHDALLKKTRTSLSHVNQPDQIKDEIRQLNALIQNNPNYYKLFEAYYCLGLKYMTLKKYSKAKKYLDKALELKPALNFYLPVNRQKEKVHTLHIQTIVDRSIWIGMGMLFLIVIIIFYSSRPWQWVTFKHLAVGIILVLVWIAVFHISFRYIGAWLESSQLEKYGTSSLISLMVFSTPGSPGSSLAHFMCLYGIVGIIGAFLFSIGVARLRRRWLAAGINAIFTILLFSALLSMFYIRNCEIKGITPVAPNKKALDFMKGTLQFYVPEPEPYILTDPKRFTRLNLLKLHEDKPYIWNWLRQFDNHSEQSTK